MSEPLLGGERSAPHHVNPAESLPVASISQTALIPTPHTVVHNECYFRLPAHRFRLGAFNLSNVSVTRMVLSMRYSQLQSPIVFKRTLEINHPLCTCRQQTRADPPDVGDRMTFCQLLERFTVSVKVFPGFIGSVVPTKFEISRGCLRGREREPEGSVPPPTPNGSGGSEYSRFGFYSCRDHGRDPPRPGDIS